MKCEKCKVNMQLVDKKTEGTADYENKKELIVLKFKCHKCGSIKNDIKVVDITANENRQIIKKWCSNITDMEVVQDSIAEKLALILDLPCVSDISEYAKEKLIKAFYENIIYLEGVLKYSEEISTNQISNSILKFSKEELFRKYDKVEKQLIAAVERLGRFYFTFLSEIWNAATS